MSLTPTHALSFALAALALAGCGKPAALTPATVAPTPPPTPPSALADTGHGAAPDAEPTADTTPNAEPTADTTREHDTTPRAEPTADTTPDVEPTALPDEIVLRLGTRDTQLPGPMGWRLAVSPDGTLAASLHDAQVCVSDLARVHLRFCKPARTEAAFEFHPDGQSLFVTTQDTLERWSTTDGEPIKGGAIPTSATQLAISSDGRRLASYSDGVVSIHQPGSKTPLATASVRGVIALRFTDDSAALIAISTENFNAGHATRIDPESGREIARVNLAKFSADSLGNVVTRTSPDGSLVATSFGKISVWNTKSGELVATLSPPGPDRVAAYASADNKPTFNALTWTPDGKRLIGAWSVYLYPARPTGEERFLTWDTATWQPAPAPWRDLIDGPAYAVATGGEAIAWGGIDGRLWRGTLAGQSTPFTTLEDVHGGESATRPLLIAKIDQKWRAIEIPSGKSVELASPPDKTLPAMDEVWRVAPNGKVAGTFLANDREVVGLGLWDVDSGAFLRTLPMPTPAYTHAVMGTFCRDWRWLDDTRIAHVEKTTLYALDATSGAVVEKKDVDSPSSCKLEVDGKTIIADDFHKRAELAPDRFIELGDLTNAAGEVTRHLLDDTRWLVATADHKFVAIANRGVLEVYDVARLLAASPTTPP